MAVATRRAPAVTLADLLEARRVGRATISFDEAWPVVGVARATFYRAAAAGEVPGVLKLGRKRLLSLPVFLAWLGAEPSPVGHCKGGQRQAP